MRIQLDSNSLPGLNGTAGTAATGRNNSSAANQTGASGDTASVSGTASLVSQLAADRATRIAHLTEIVRNGSYDVPSSAIARALVSEAYG